MSDKLSIAGPLRIIRNHLEISRQSLAGSLCSATFIEMIEKSTRNPSLDTIQTLADALCCEPADLLSEPNPSRLAEIRAAYTQRVADAARTAAEGLAS